VIKVSIGTYQTEPKPTPALSSPLPKSLEVLIKEYKIEEVNNSLDPKVIIELSKEILEEIQIKLEIYLESKPTRDLKFNKIYLVKELEIPEYLINLYFKKYLNISFKNWKNEVRIRDSNSLIEDGFLISHTVDALAHEVGFLSRSRFVQAFQKINKCPPSQYLKNSD
jgi:AraC-like DNA-binding protein